jgi:hypothetical protein
MKILLKIIAKISESNFIMISSIVIICGLLLIITIVKYYMLKKYHSLPLSQPELHLL